uniref:Uncharacterized protein n=1 Tax=Cucumis sativus TaxID=3659 RepID=A0A0A0L824_CUCSA
MYSSLYMIVLLLTFRSLLELPWLTSQGRRMRMKELEEEEEKEKWVPLDNGEIKFGSAGLGLAAAIWLLRINKSKSTIDHHAMPTYSCDPRNWVASQNQTILLKLHWRDFSAGRNFLLLNEECEDLHQRMRNGLLRKPTVVELYEKAKSLHEDITKHVV